jgi:hypothetical protein
VRRSEGGMAPVDVLVRGAAHFGALEFPGREAALVEVVSIQDRHNSGSVKFNLEFHLVALHLMATYRTCHAAALSAKSPVGLSDGQPPAPDRLPGLLSEDGFIGHEHPDSTSSQIRHQSLAISGRYGRADER